MASAHGLHEPRELPGRSSVAERMEITAAIVHLAGKEAQKSRELPGRSNGAERMKTTFTIVHSAGKEV